MITEIFFKGIIKSMKAASRINSDEAQPSNVTLTSKAYKSTFLALE
jgi:hypothetical protein